MQADWCSMAEPPQGERFAPAREQVAAWQHAIGRARAEAQRLPDVFVQKRFERALRHVAGDLRRIEDAPDVDAALLEALEGARDKLAEARAVLAPLRTARGAVERTLRVLAMLEGALSEARLPTADAATLASSTPRPIPSLRSSPGVPR